MRVVPFALAALALLAGCAPVPPYEQAVEAGSPVELSMWRSRLDRELTREQWRWFDVAIQEYKYEVMFDGTVSGGDAVAAAVREKINGRALRDVVRDGLTAHLARKIREEHELEAAIAMNDKLHLPENAFNARRELAEHQANLRAKLPKLNADLDAVQAEISRLAALPRG